MSNDEREALRLRELASSVADESPIDWEAELRSSAHFESKVRQLRLIESIASAYRSLPTAKRGPATDETRGAHEIAGSDARGASDGPDPVGSRTGTPPAVVPERWGTLEIREWIGSGSFGEVYRAHDTQLNRDVALKLLHSARTSNPEEAEQFLKEARQLAQVQHSNVLVVHGAGRHDGRIGLWTDLIRGNTLEDELERRGRYGGDEAAQIGIAMCQALAEVHAKGLVHRDVKTANVMREEGGKYVLLDFSTVTKRSVAPVERLTDSMAGTPLFMAPEAFAGIDSGCRADIYSLGVVIYRLVTGKYPIEAHSLTELVERHGEFRHTLLRDARPDLSDALIAVVERAIDVDPERRFGSMGELEQALRAAIGQVPHERQETEEDKYDRRRRDNRTWRTTTTVLAAVLVVALTVWGWNRFSNTAGGFEVEATLQLDSDAGPIALDQGALIQPEDALFLELEGSQPMYVYVVNEDRSGRETVLFPLKSAASENPLAPDRVHELPGVIDGERRAWEVTSADGGDSIIVLVSGRRETEIERIFELLPHADDDPSAREDTGEGDDYAGVLRGIGGLAPARPRESQGATKIMRSARRDQIRIWEWRLKNP